jgi:hypothetical protein
LPEAAVRAWAEDVIAAAPQPAPTGVAVVDLFWESQLEGMHGADGIVEDIITIREPWTIDLDAIAASVRLFHAVDDDRAPIEGARFLAETLRAAELVLWDTGGHAAAASHLPEILESVLPEE